MGIFDRIKRIIQSNINSNGDAHVDSLLNEEDDELKRIIDELNGSPNAKQTGRKTNTNSASKKDPQVHAVMTAYSLLGVKPSSTIEQIKSAYRKQIALVHPDKVATKSKAEQDRAKQRAQELNTAYELIQRIRNFS